MGVGGSAGSDRPRGCRQMGASDEGGSAPSASLLAPACRAHSVPGLHSDNLPPLRVSEPGPSHRDGAFS